MVVDVIGIGEEVFVDVEFVIDVDRVVVGIAGVGVGVVKDLDTTNTQSMEMIWKRRDILIRNSFTFSVQHRSERGSLAVVFY